MCVSHVLSMKLEVGGEKMRFMFCSCLCQALSRHMNWLPWLEVTGQITGCISLCAESLMLTKLTILPVMFNFRDCCARKKK